MRCQPLRRALANINRKEFKLNNRDFFKNHPITYKSVLFPFITFFIISTVCWFFIFLDFNPKFFSDFLVEQIALKWIWLFASVSLSFLTIKFSINGTVNYHDDKLVRLLGVNCANTALAMSSTYVGIMWGALIPTYFLQGDIPIQFSVIHMFNECLYAVFYVLFFYFSYFALTTEVNRSSRFYKRRNEIIVRVLVAIFSFVFISGRLLDILKVFRPELF